MKKIVLWASIVALCLVSFNFVNADHHADMMETQSDYWIFTGMVRDDLSDSEKDELNVLIWRQKNCQNTVKSALDKVNSWESTNFEEFANIAPRRNDLMWKLKPFMKDSEAFEYMCMNIWDNLIAKFFANDNLVSSYKMLLEAKYKSKVEALYAQSWKKLEKTIHGLYNKNIETQNVQNISLLRALELIIEDIKANDFWDFTAFARQDLTETQKQWLRDLLWERKVAQSKFKTMLTEAKENGNFEEVFEIVQNKRAWCKARFELYLDSSKSEAFDSHCKMLWEKLKASFID